MSKLFKVAKQEFKMTAANKAFVIITLIGPFLLLAMTVLPTLLANNNTDIQEGTVIGINGLNDSHYIQMTELLDGSNVEIFDVADNAVEAKKKEVIEGNISGLIVLPEDYKNAGTFPFFSKSGTEMMLISALQNTLSKIIVDENVKEAGLDPVIVDKLTARPNIDVIKLTSSGDGQKEEKQDFLSVMLTCLAFVMLIYMTVLLYGQMIGRSVSKEKSSKTVEIMLSSVTPRDLMFGKIFGIGFAGIVQYAFWIVLAVLLTTVLSPLLGISALGSSLSMANLGYLVLFFILAYFLYSSCYAALGSGAEDDHHLGQLAMPILVFLIIPLMMISSIVMNPDSTLSVFMSFFPMTAPLVMLMRIVVSTPPVWQIALSVGLVALTTVLVIMAAAKIFRVGILMTGKRFKMSEIFTWLRY